MNTEVTVLAYVRSCTSRVSIVLATIAMTSGPARGQSLNVDFGPAETVPAPTYAAAAEAGIWNAVPVLPAGERFPLVNLAGQPIAAQIYQIGGSSLLVADDPGTTGDDAALVDDMFIGFNNPLDVCVWINNLINGDYDVFIYGITPDDPDLMSRVRVDNASPGPIWIGGPWPGGHVEGITYQRFRVFVFDGVIGLHSGLVSAQVQSGINGIQIVRLAEAGVESGLGASPGLARVPRVFPNPSTGPQVIEIELGSTVSGQLEVVSPTGRVVWQAPLGPLGAGSHQLTWPGRDQAGRSLPAGVYFLRLHGVSAKLHPLVLVR